MAKIKEEPIFVGIGENIIELTGADKEAFLEQRVKDNQESELLELKKETQKQIKISAYEKLGLTDEEIAAII